LFWGALFHAGRDSVNDLEIILEGMRYKIPQFLIIGSVNRSRISRTSSGITLSAR
jgi:hypothetical protein